MKKYLSFGVVLVSLSLNSCGGKPGGATPLDLPKIFTTGQAERRIEPNMAYITFAVLTRASNAEKARAENASRVSALMKKVKEMKIPESDLETLDYRIREILNYQNGTQKIEAYEVMNRMQIKLLDVKKVGALIDQLVPFGANKVDSVEFDVAEKEEIYRELLETATSQAREKASRMSEAAGLGKVTVLELREEREYSEAPMSKYSMLESVRTDAASTQFAPSAILKAKVSLTAKARE